MRYDDNWKRERLSRGEPLHFPENLEEEDRIVQAEWLEEAARAGKVIDVDHAIVRGAIDLKYATIAEELSVRRSEFTDRVDFPYASARRPLSFNGTLFREAACFDRMTLDGELTCRETVFCKEASFYRVNFKASVYFEQPTGGAGNQTTFGGPLDFRYCSVAGEAYFDRVIFTKSVYFGGTEIRDNAHFVATSFMSEADFIGTNFKGTAYFDYDYQDEDRTGATFGGSVTFNMATIGKSAFFDRCSFEGNAIFGALTVGMDSSFMGTSFHKDATFDGMKIEGKCLFHGAHFTENAYLVRTRFGSDVYFQDACVGRNDLVDYYEGTIFEKLASFNGSKFSLGLYLDGELQTYGTFNEALPEVDEPSLSSDRFRGPIDLRGCTYDSIHVSSWQFLLERYQQYLERYKLYDPQPYIQLEKALRAKADIHGADEVYYQRRVQESQKRSGLYWVGDWILRLLVGYGVGYKKLFGWIAAFVVAGMLIFQFPGAVRPAAELDFTKPLPEPIAAACNDQGNDCDVALLEAAGVSLNTFLPIQLPIGETWEPSYVVLASLIKLAGWLIVPLGVAALTGLLQRSSAA